MMDWPGFSAKPPPPKLSPGITAGQIVSLQSFMIVKILADSDNSGPAQNPQFFFLIFEGGHNHEF